MVSMFAGVNSPDGFVSKFDMIQNEEAGCKKIYIKGGPGTGKSGVLKRIAAKAEAEGYFVETFPCSSDPDSLDGVNIPSLKTALVDATAPHSADPVYPAVSGFVFNTADCLDPDKIALHSEQIRLFSDMKRTDFEKGYNCLAAAKHIIENCGISYRGYTSTEAIADRCRITAKKFLPSSGEPGGRIRSLFLSAICPDGRISLADRLFQGVDIISVKGRAGTHLFMKRLADAAVSAGYDITVFSCPMFPDQKYEHIYIPQKNLAFCTYSYYHHTDGTEVIDLDPFITCEFTADEGYGEIAESLINKGAECFARAKGDHAFVEKFYIEAMDFSKLDKMTDKLEESIFG